MKKLHMIGNSHIDPVWFWDKREGMQSVKSTFASAIDRLKEYPEFTFTSGSSYFYKWLEKTSPDLFAQIKAYVKDGRWSVVGGFVIEPDCHMPSGEAFVRQGLYAQRYFQKAFGREAKVGYCVDSFGHSAALPQLLKGLGLDSYAYLRPQSSDGPKLYRWRAVSGDEVTAIHIIGEYTTWFEENTIKNIDKNLDEMGELQSFPCFFGVGNHGGGPTIANIETILRARSDYAGRAEFEFSTLERFLAEVDREALPVVTGETPKCNTGCFSVQSDVKALNRRAENAAVRAEKLASMAFATGYAHPPANADECTRQFEKLWETICFNQFHDILPGTSIQAAHDETVMQLGGAISAAAEIESEAIQRIVNGMETLGAGFPLFVFNAHGYAVRDVIEVELEWFCKDSLRVLNSQGDEVPYHRISSATPVIHTSLGGRRRFLLPVELPPYGFAVYRTLAEEPSPSRVTQESNPFILDNGLLRVEISPESGFPIHIIEAATGFDALSAPMSAKIYTDEKDAWGGGKGRYEAANGGFVLTSCERVETGALRNTIRAVFSYQNSEMILLYRTSAGMTGLDIKGYVRWNERYTRLKLCWDIAAAAPAVRAEIPYGFIDRPALEDGDQTMQRWIDLHDTASGGGLTIANDGQYAYGVDGARLEITLLRSTIYAQGDCQAEWYKAHNTYRYTDLGEHDFCFTLLPHGASLPNYAACHAADRLNMPPVYLADSCHHGAVPAKASSFFSCDKPNILLGAVKHHEENAEGLVLRLVESEGRDTGATVCFYGNSVPLSFRPCEIKTLRITAESAEECNLLEQTAHP